LRFCEARGWVIKEVVKEIGSGLNDRLPKLLNLLSEGKAARIVVEHKDRLTRFGFSYIKELCRKFNCEITVINEVEGDKEDLIQDFVSVITSFCARVYGQRRSRRKTEFLIKELEKGEGE
jgi:predicted site-specific integrase-resolvase